MRVLPLGLLTVVATASPLAAQEGQGDPAQAPSFEQAFAAWQDAHGAAWRAAVDPATDRLELLYGYNVAPDFVPDADADWFALARHWVSETQALHGIEDWELNDLRVQYLPLGMANGTDKLTVRLTQSVQGLPVEDGVVNVLFDTGGRLLSIHSTAAPETGHIVLAPGVSGRLAQGTARATFEQVAGVPAVTVGAPLLLIAQVEQAGQRKALLAYRVEVRNAAEPAGKAVVIDAQNGAVLRVDELIHYLDVTGTIKSMATPGVEADHAGNPPAEIPIGHVDVQGSNGQTVQTDRDGNFNFPGVNTPLNLTVDFDGPFNRVFNSAGAEYSITFNNVQPNQGNDLLMNPNPTEYVTAQANAFEHVSILRDYVRDTIPTDNTADFKATSNANINSSCNAYFDGGSVNYFRDQGGCNNTAFSTVVAHEMGHWLNVKYGTGNGSDGMGEGNADVFAMYVYDDPVVGSYFFNGGGFVRTGENTVQFCGDNNGGCYGGVHENGKVWMGAAWKVRRNLKTSLGDALGGATADLLFMGWMNGYNQTQIKSIIEIQWLTLDDDNGDINDGTPNYPEIDAGFLEQGFPGFDLDFFTWGAVTQLPDVAVDNGPYTVDADVIATLVPPVQGVDLHWSVTGGATQTVAMSPAGGNTFSGDIPSIGGPGFVEYWLTATDSQGNSEDFPLDGSRLSFDVEVATMYHFDFESDQGWISGVAGDNALTGLWERDDPVGTVAQPEDDVTAGGVSCWMTQQGSPGGHKDINDVDGGKTTLRSPTLDLGHSASDVRISYWRWFSNDEGNQPNAEVFEVEISNDNGQSWTLVETVGPESAHSSGGWFESSFMVEDYVSLSSTMRIQFRAADFGQDSTIEAAIDEVVIGAINPGCPPVDYCVTSPNSVGTGAVMFSFGSLNVADNDFTLGANGAVAGQPGLFYYGPNQANIPTGDGVLCVGNPVFRLPVVGINPLGVATHTLDFNNLPPGGQIQPGDTMNFAFWYRDPTGGPAGYNFSNGRQVTFCGN